MRCGNHNGRVRTSLPQPLQCDSQPVTTIALQITMAVTHRTAGAPSGDGSWLRNTVLWLEQLEASSPHIDAPAGCMRSMIAMHFEA